jgi:hypothetical protein
VRFRHLGDGQARALLVEGLDHFQAFFEAGDEVARSSGGSVSMIQNKWRFVRVSHKVCALRNGPLVPAAWATQGWPTIYRIDKTT